MKKIVSLCIPLLFIACSLDDDLPREKTTKHGKRWTLQIGSSPKETYKQLQGLGKEKNFDQVAVVYRKPYSKPSEIKSNLNLYRAVSVETTSGKTERILFQFRNDRVNSIEIGGGLLDSIAKWPQNIANKNAIHVNDPVSEVREKLITIYEIPQYQNYHLILSDKWLKKAYDPDMDNYEEWAFSFSKKIGNLKDGRHSVRLYFKNEKLIKIRDTYDELELVY